MCCWLWPEPGGPWPLSPAVPGVAGAPGWPGVCGVCGAPEPACCCSPPPPPRAACAAELGPPGLPPATSSCGSRQLLTTIAISLGPGSAGGSRAARRGPRGARERWEGKGKGKGGGGGGGGPTGLPGVAGAEPEPGTGLCLCRRCCRRRYCLGRPAAAARPPALLAFCCGSCCFLSLFLQPPQALRLPPNTPAPLTRSPRAPFLGGPRSLPPPHPPASELPSLAFFFFPKLQNQKWHRRQPGAARGAAPGAAGMGHGARTHSPSASPAPPRTHTLSHTLAHPRRAPARPPAARATRSARAEPT